MASNQPGFLPLVTVQAQRKVGALIFDGDRGCWLRSLGSIWGLGFKLRVKDLGFEVHSLRGSGTRIRAGLSAGSWDLLLILQILHEPGGQCRSFSIHRSIYLYL